MSNAKPWQIIVIVAAAVVVVVAAVYTFSGRRPIRTPDRLTLVDVETGRLYTASARNGGVSVPAINPETGRRSIVSVWRDEEGRWVANPRELSLLPSFQVVPKVVDATGHVRASDEKPTVLK